MITTRLLKIDGQLVEIRSDYFRLTVEVTYFGKDGSVLDREKVDLADAAASVFVWDRALGRFWFETDQPPKKPAMAVKPVNLAKRANS